MLRDIFGFAQGQEIATYGLRYFLTITRKSNNAVLIRSGSVANDKVLLLGTDWFWHVLHTVYISKQCFLSGFWQKPQMIITTLIDLFL